MNEAKGLGFVQSELDPRDYVFKMAYKGTLPPTYNGYNGIPVHDQGKFNNCGTHALAELVEINLQKAGKFHKVSFPWYYGNRRHTEHKGEGTEARGLLKAAQKDGGLAFERYSLEEEMVKAMETFNKKYPLYKEEAQDIRIRSYYECVTVDDVKAAVYHYRGVLVGAILFKSFYRVSKDNPVMPEPIIHDSSLEEMLGGHMMLIVGWDDSKKSFLVLNSWGKSFGKQGLFYMPYTLMTWHERKGFPMPLLELWAVDGIYLNGKLLNAVAEPVEPPKQTGWYKKGSRWRYKNNGKDVTGWLQVQDIWYYLNSDGFMATGWVKYDNDWYYLNPNGSMRIGWLKLDGRWYWFGVDGKAAKGFQTIDGKRYYFAEKWIEGVKECQLIVTDENGAIK